MEKVPRPLLGATTVCYPLSVSPCFTLEQAFDGIARSGLNFVEMVAIPGYCEHLRPDQMGDSEIARVQHLLDQYGLSPSVINVAANLTTESGVEFLGHAMRIARALDVRTVVTAVEETESQAGAERFMGLVPVIDTLATRYDVVVALEIHGGLVTTGPGGVATLKEIGSERFKLTYDMANIVYYAGVRPEEDLAEMGQDIGRFIGHVHLKDKANMQLHDYDFPPFGTGILDFGTVLKLLYQGGYRGPMTLEVELDGKPESSKLVGESLVQSYHYLEQFWSDGQAT